MSKIKFLFKNVDLEKELFEKKMKEAEEKREELDSGIGSRNESAEVYEADADKSGSDWRGANIEIYLAFHDIQISARRRRRRKLFPPDEIGVDGVVVDCDGVDDDDVGVCSRWHPEVGRAPPPNLQDVWGRTKHYNTQYKPKSPRWSSFNIIYNINWLINARRVEIFNDKDYLKEMRQSRGKRRRRRKKDDKSDVEDPDRPRSLGRFYRERER